MDTVSNEATAPADTQAADDGPKTLNAKRVKRRLARIDEGQEPKKVSKRRNKLAAKILLQMASGDIKNPRAVARAFARAE